MRKCLILLTFLPFGVFSQKGSNNMIRPNIIFIIADDLGYNNVGFNGQTKIKTPNIDKLARDGIIFKNHYSGSPVCGPSRSCLLSGNHTGHTRIRENPGWGTADKKVDFPNTDLQLAKTLKAADYQTAVIGKWGMSDWGKDMQANTQGFDYFFGYRGHGEAHHYYPTHLWKNEEKIPLIGNVTAQKKGQYAHDLIAKEALDYVEKASKEKNPFFLYLAFTIPHLELTVPEDSKAQYKNLGWEEYPMKDGHYHNDPEGNTTFAGMISRMDSDIGKLMELLKKQGIDENTLVIFTSDNGAEYSSDFFENNRPFKGKKRDVYDGGIHIPFVAKWTGKIKAGSTTEHISAFWDFLPTVNEIAGKKLPSDIDGLSYLPTLLGKSKDQKKHEYLYWEFNEGTPKQAIRYENWKFIKLWNKPVELYDVSKDISEEKNVANENPKLVEKFSKILESARSNDPNYDLVPVKQKGGE